MNLRELAQKPNKLSSGHRTCAGCGIPIIIRTVLAAIDQPVVVANSTSCSEVTTTIYPQNAWKVPYIHSAFGNTAAVICGVERAYQYLRKKRKISKDIKFAVFAGDGGSYDIGLQALSGAIERGHNFLFVCYDNGAYMNTGNQRSGATPKGAATSTTPLGKKSFGKPEERKNFVEIITAHNPPYVAQSAVHHWADLVYKTQKAVSKIGPTVLNVLMPCTLMWKFPTNQTINVSKLAAETCFWPLYEIEEGKYKVNYKPAKKLPLQEFFKKQKRFSHLLKPENTELLQEIQEKIDANWERLLEEESRD